MDSTDDMWRIIRENEENDRREDRRQRQEELRLAGNYPLADDRESYHPMKPNYSPKTKTQPRQPTKGWWGGKVMFYLGFAEIFGGFFYHPLTVVGIIQIPIGWYLGKDD